MFTRYIIERRYDLGMFFGYIIIKWNLQSPTRRYKFKEFQCVLLLASPHPPPWGARFTLSTIYITPFENANCSTSNMSILE